MLFKKIFASKKRSVPAGTITEKMADVEKQLTIMRSLEEQFNHLLQNEKQSRLTRQTTKTEQQVRAFIREAIAEQFAPISQSVKECTKSLAEIEKRVRTLERRSSHGPDSGKPVVYQEIKVDKVFVEKYDQVTNLGSIGIRELGGQLNIGTTYGSGTLPEEVGGDLKAGADGLKKMKEKMPKKGKQEHARPVK